MSIDNINLDAALDIEYYKDIDELKKEWAKVDKKDSTNLFKWFTDHSYLSVYDMMVISGLCRTTLHKMRKHCGIVMKNNFDISLPRTPVKQKRKEPIIAPENWDNDWLVKMYNDGHSVKQLAKAVDLDSSTVHSRLRRRTKMRDVKDIRASKNQCCVLTWVFEHYVEKKLSIGKCAKLAGISPSGFGMWLSKFNIRRRTKSEQSLIQNGTDLGKRARKRTYEQHNR